MGWDRTITGVQELIVSVVQYSPNTADDGEFLDSPLRGLSHDVEGSVDGGLTGRNGSVSLELTTVVRTHAYVQHLGMRKFTRLGRGEVQHTLDTCQAISITPTMRTVRTHLREPWCSLRQ